MRRDPLFILAPPRSFTSLVNSVVGQHPLSYGLPELNLFMAGNMQQFWDGTDEDGSHKALSWPIMRHGLLRAVAQLYAGEQTIESIKMAQRWIMSRRRLGTGEVYRMLLENISPLMAVEKSPAYLVKPVYLQRLRQTFPQARFIHVTRHPIGMGESILKTPGGKWVLLGSNSIAEVNGERIIDPQFLWYDANIGIMEFLDDLPGERWMRVRGEDFLTDLDGTLHSVCEWLGFPHGPEEIEAMKHPERSPYACVGPVNARLGNDINFLEDPQIRPARVKDYDLDAPLSWRPDGAPVFEEVAELALAFGYESVKQDSIQAGLEKADSSLGGHTDEASTNRKSAPTGRGARNLN